MINDRPEDGLACITALHMTPVRTESSKPEAYRLCRKADGILILQGLFTWAEGMMGGVDWRDLPTVDDDVI